MVILVHKNSHSQNGSFSPRFSPKIEVGAFNGVRAKWDEGCLYGSGQGRARVQYIHINEYLNIRLLVILGSC